HVLVVGDGADDAIEASGLERAEAWDAVLASGEADDALSFTRVAFDAPSFVLYTSGTTGLPKCIVHGAGGMLVQLAKEIRLHYDVGPGDRFFYHTSTGWNMWYWNVIALATGATLVLWDGAPFAPTPTALFDLADEEGVHAFGISPPYLAML